MLKRLDLCDGWYFELDSENQYVLMSPTGGIIHFDNDVALEFKKAFDSLAYTNTATVEMFLPHKLTKGRVLAAISFAIKFGEREGVKKMKNVAANKCNHEAQYSNGPDELSQEYQRACFDMKNEILNIDIQQVLKGD